jgi:hypothetical protein
LLLQKLFQCDIFSKLTKTTNQFPLQFLLSSVDLLVIIIINYKKYKNIAFSKRN